MNLKIITAATALPLSLLLGVGTAAASFHHNGGSSAQFQGTVTSLSSSSIAILTSSGRVSFTLAGSTHVSRWAFGSLADIHINQYVSLHLVKGSSSTVDSINLNTTVPPPGGHPLFGGLPGDVPDQETPHEHGSADNRPAGYVTAVSGSGISIRDSHGRVSTYALTSSVTVTKCLTRSLADLAIGETVRVDRGRGGAATSIPILNA